MEIIDVFHIPEKLVEQQDKCIHAKDRMEIIHDFRIPEKLVEQ